MRPDGVPIDVSEYRACPICGFLDYLYQYSYPGKQGYISPRCLSCLETVNEE